MSILGLDLPSMSEVVRDRREAERVTGLELRLAAETQRANRIARAASISVARQYRAAAATRYTTDWPASQTTWHAEIYRNLRSLRARSRDMSRNNPHMKRFFGMVRRNVVGPAGIKLQVRAKKTGDEMDELLNTAVEEAFAEWSLPENCSASGKLSWRDAQGMAVQTMARDGEFLCRFIEADNPFGFALKFYDVAYLDETFNEVLRNGNRILMSVEVDRYDRPQAYYFTTPTQDISTAAAYGQEAMERVRVPADQVIHSYLPFEDDGQIRGVPWAHAAMLELRMLGQYTEAELINSHLSACKMGWVIPPANDENAGIPDDDEPTRAQIGDRVEPGLIQELPPGYDFKTFDPEHPGDTFDPFTSTVLRYASCGLDVSYFALGGDLTAVNYSSARVGLLDDRDNYRGIQNFLVDHFCRRVYREWLKRAFLTNVIRGVLPSDYERLKSPEFQPRGWAWVDPLKDIAASVEAINNGLTTRSQVIAEQGGNFEDVALRLAQEQEILARLKIVLKSADLATLAAIASATGGKGE